MTKLIFHVEVSYQVTNGPDKLDEVKKRLKRAVETIANPNREDDGITSVDKVTMWNGQNQN